MFEVNNTIKVILNRSHRSWSSIDENTHEIPNGNVIAIRDEQFRSPEVQSSLLGIVHELVYSITKCDEDIRKECMQTLCCAEVQRYHAWVNGLVAGEQWKPATAYFFELWPWHPAGDVTRFSVVPRKVTVKIGDAENR